MATTRYRLRALTSSSSDWRRSRSEMTVIPLHCLSQHLRVKTLASHNFRSPHPPLSQRRGIVNPKLILHKKAETMWGFRMMGQGGHVEVRAATQTRRVGGSVGVEHERCRIPEGVMTRNRMRRVAARALAETPPTPPSPSLVLPCSIRVEEVQQAALLQKPAAADYAKQRRRVPVLQH